MKTSYENLVYTGLENCLVFQPDLSPFHKPTPEAGIEGKELDMEREAPGPHLALLLTSRVALGKLRKSSHFSSYRNKDAARFDV